MAMRTSFLGVLTILVAIGATVAQPQQAANPAPTKPEPGKPIEGLQLTLDRVDHGVLEVTLQNVGDSPVVLNLGFMLNNGRVLVPYQLRLVVNGASGTVRQFQWKVGGVAGRMDDFLVPLMPTAKYTMTLSLNDFIDANGTPAIAAGDRVLVVYEGATPTHPNGIPNLPIWNHRVETAPRRYGE